MAKVRRSYSREFKLETVKLVTEKGYSVAGDSEDNGVMWFYRYKSGQDASRKK